MVNISFVTLSTKILKFIHLSNNIDKEKIKIKRVISYIWLKKKLIYQVTFPSKVFSSDFESPTSQVI